MPLPPRRWFQFSLSTWFVLVAILLSTLPIRPWLVTTAFDTGPIDKEAYDTPSLIERRSLNPVLIYPTLALTAFVGWKAAWAIGQHVARRKAEQV